MESELQMRIKLKYNTFSAAKKRLSDFVLDNPGFVLHQSISDVAAECGITEATISRYCKELGYKSYYDFKLAIVQHFPRNEADDFVSSDISPDAPISTVTKNILAKDIEALNETNNLIDEDDIIRCVDMLTEADRIIFFGVGSSLSSALEGCNKFIRITPKASINLETHMQYATACLMTERDVAVIISYSGSTPEVVEVAKAAHESGARIICITKYIKSPLTRYSDVTLICSSNERHVGSFSMSVELTQIFLLDVLYTEYFRHNYEQASANQDRTSTLLSTVKKS